MKKNGFTIIELMIVLAILGILSALALSSCQGPVQCIGGYEFTKYSHPTQILDDQGHGIKCQ